MGVTIADNDVVGVVVTPATVTLYQNDTVGQAVQVALSSQPLGTVTVSLANAEARVTLSSSVITFTPSTFATPVGSTLAAVYMNVAEDNPRATTVAVAATGQYDDYLPSRETASVTAQVINNATVAVRASMSS